LGGGRPNGPAPGTGTNGVWPPSWPSPAASPRVTRTTSGCRLITNEFWQSRNPKSEEVLLISKGATTTTMSARTPARSRQQLMSPKSTATAGGWRCVCIGVQGFVL
jgi:hypothetical protein